MHPEKVFDLLEQWHDLRSQGQSIAVEELCRECPELAGELARLVRAVEATDWLEERYTEVGAVSRSLASPEELGLPGKVGRYELSRLIGEGGFGFVLRGYDPELRRQVAVKVARPSRATSPEQTERFLEEARRAAQLRHPNIVPVHDVGRDGRWIYIVSDLVEGCDLGTAARQRRVPTEESARIVARVADALQCAHAKGLVHRDVKPANILLDRDGDVFLTDFGIAVTQEQLQGGPVPSEGTLAYMAPEQLTVDGQLGPQCDVYSLGVVLYELLTERRPSRDAPPPSTSARSLPVGLDAVCLRALAPLPADRFASAADFAQAIRGAMDKNRRRRMLPAMVVLVGMAAVLGAGLLVAQRVRQSQPPPPAEDAAPTRLDGGPPPVAGAMLFEGHHYKYIQGNVTWYEAERRCEEMGGCLAMIKSQREQQFLAGMLGLDESYVYIGLTDEGREGDWRWVDGSPAAYTNWARGEPNHFGGIEHWVAVNPSAGSTWGDIAVGHFRVGGFVCQWGPDKPARPYSRSPPPADLRPEDYRPGLVAELFDDTAFRQRVAGRIDRKIDFEWGKSLPHPALRGDHFAIRWCGYLKPPKAGRYTIVVRSCNGACVVLDGVVINGELLPEKHWCLINKADLTAGYHALQIDLVHGAGEAHCRVRWGTEQGKDMLETTIGPECFFHDAKQELTAGVQ